MSTDLVHHLEGALVPQGTFKVYMYDAYTQPLVLEDMREVSGFVEIGETVDAERVTLKLNSDGKTLDADIGKDPKFPVTLTLYLHLPGLAPDAKPELFTFHFARYSGATTGTTGMKEMKDMKDMPGMN